MKKIFKYKLPKDGETIIIKAHVITWLNVGVQNGEPYIWAIVDEDGAPCKLKIAAWGTGWTFPDTMLNHSYLGTVQDGDGYVWHYFLQDMTDLFKVKEG